MKGAFLVTEDPQFFGKAMDLLVSKGALYAADAGAVQIGGRGDDVFTLYDSAEPEWEYRLGPFRAAPGVVVPDMSAAIGLAVECNSEDFFVEMVGEIALVSRGAIWVLDGDGVVWAAHALDPATVRL